MICRPGASEDGDKEHRRKRFWQASGGRQMKQPGADVAAQDVEKSHGPDSGQDIPPRIVSGPRPRKDGHQRDERYYGEILEQEHSECRLSVLLTEFALSFQN